MSVFSPDIIQSFIDNFFIYTFSLLFTLIIVVSLHEAGHYFACRLCNVRVDRFSFGFGKELFGLGGKNGKTRWSFCIIPLGGYIKIFGDVDPQDPQIWDSDKNIARPMDEAERADAFCTKTVFQRMFIVFAGPAVNLALTILVFLGMFTLYGERSSPVYINTILVGSESDKAGIQVGDQILSMNGKAIRRLEDIYKSTWNDLPPTTNRYTIMRDGQKMDIEFAARHVIYETEKGIHMSHGQTGMVRMGRLGLEDIKSINGQKYSDINSVRQGILDHLDQIVVFNSPFKGTSEMELQEDFRTVFPSEYNEHLNDPDDENYDLVFLTPSEERLFVKLQFFEAINRSLTIMKDGVVNTYKLIKASIAGKNDSRIVAGIGKLSESTGEAFKAGFYEFMMIFAIFNFMIAIVNLLPIPGLDGGYLMFLTWEKIAGKPASQKFQSITLILGLALLWGIMVFANISDILLFLNPH